MASSPARPQLLACTEAVFCWDRYDGSRGQYDEKDGLFHYIRTGIPFAWQNATEYITQNVLSSAVLSSEPQRYPNCSGLKYVFQIEWRSHTFMFSLLLHHGNWKACGCLTRVPSLFDAHRLKRMEELELTPVLCDLEVSVDEAGAIIITDPRSSRAYVKVFATIATPPKNTRPPHGASPRVRRSLGDTFAAMSMSTQVQDRTIYEYNPYAGASSEKWIAVNVKHMNPLH